MIPFELFNRLLHDIKRIAIQITLIKGINKKKIRDSMLELLSQELERMLSDLNTLKEALKIKDKGIKKEK